MIIQEHCNIDQEEIEAVKKEQEAAAKAAEPPLPTSFEGASPELRSVLNKLNTPKEAAEALKSAETALERLSIDLADPDKVGQVWCGTKGVDERGSCSTRAFVQSL